MEWAPQQHEALVAVRKWLDTDPEVRPQIFRLFGYAGSGKTTLAIEISRMVDGDCLFGSFTGKAALVMRKKGCHGAQTLHSMIYLPRRDKRGDEELDRDVPMWKINPESALRYAELLIIDECSMVGEDLATDVLSFKTPVLVLGDPAQLPPVGGAGYFTEVAKPDIMLTEIHRQAADNPIIRIATNIRLGRGIDIGSHKGAFPGQGVSIIRREDLKLSSQLAADQVLCGKNDTRVTINRRIRQALRDQGKLPATPRDALGRSNTSQAIDDLPVIGDRIICLKNKRDRGLLNGGMWTVEDLRDRSSGAKKRGRAEVSYLDVKSIDNERHYVDVAVPHAFWFWNNRENDLQLPERMHRGHYDEFDYAYGITCHKSQGSQWDKVVVIDEGDVFGGRGDREDVPRRWRYTAVTRAAEALILAV